MSNLLTNVTFCRQLSHVRGQARSTRVSGWTPGGTLWKIFPKVPVLHHATSMLQLTSVAGQPCSLQGQGPRSTHGTAPSANTPFANMNRVGTLFFLSHGVLPCQADPTFAAYPYSATRSSGGTPQLAASGESFTSSLAGRAGGCVRPPGANSITSFCSNDSLSDVLNCTVHPLRLESSVLKHPFLQLCFVCQPFVCY